MRDLDPFEIAFFSLIGIMVLALAAVIWTSPDIRTQTTCGAEEYRNITMRQDIWVYDYGDTQQNCLQLSIDTMKPNGDDFTHETTRHTIRCTSEALTCEDFNR